MKMFDLSPNWPQSDRHPRVPSIWGVKFFLSDFNNSPIRFARRGINVSKQKPKEFFRKKQILTPNNFSELF